MPREEEYAVYSTLIKEVFLGGKPPGSIHTKIRQVVIESKTVEHDPRQDPDGDKEVVRELRAALLPETLASFRSRNRVLPDGYEIQTCTVLQTRQVPSWLLPSRT